jgi:phosphate transport system permease protein
MKMKRIKERFGSLLLKGSAVLILLIVAILLFFIGIEGIRVINLEFLFSFPKEGMTSGGVFPAIFGTVALTLITTFFSIPFGIGAAIFLSEYAKEGRLTSFIRASIRNLAGVPSIVYGLFGVAIFVQSLNIGASILASGLTLGLLTLPWVIAVSEESLKSVPRSFREGALALGATKWQTTRLVLRYAMPGILTGAILGLSRAAGETAPILFTGVCFWLPELPSSIFDQFMALPYHLYILSTQHYDLEKVKPLAFGTAAVLILLVFGLNLIALIIRTRLRKDYG